MKQGTISIAHGLSISDERLATTFGVSTQSVSVITPQNAEESMTDNCEDDNLHLKKVFNKDFWKEICQFCVQRSIAPAQTASLPSPATWAALVCHHDERDRDSTPHPRP